MLYATAERPDECPQMNNCFVTLDDGPECGSAPEHAQAIPTAEQFCVRALYGYREHFAWRVKGDAPEAADLGLAWNSLELGLAVRNEDDSASHFDHAQQQVDDALAYRPTSKLDFTWGAIMLRAYLPLFRARRHQRPETIADDEAFEHRRNGLNVAYDAAVSAPLHTRDKTHWDARTNDHVACVDHEGTRTRYLTETSLHMLLARSGIVLFPASLRESTPRTADEGWKAHSSYVLDGATKLPIKLIATTARKGSNQGASSSVMRLRYPGLVNETRERLRYGDRNMLDLYKALEQWSHNPASLPQKVGQWLRQEAADQPIEPEGTALLDLVAGALQERLRIFRANPTQ